MPNNKLSTTQQNNNLPDYLRKEDGDLGVDSIGSEDIVVPRLKIVQGQSTIKDKNDKLKDGELYHSLEGTSFGKEVELFSLLHWKSRVWFSDDFKLLGTEFRDPETKEIKRFGSEIEDILSDKERYEAGMDSHNYMVVLRSQLKECIAIGTMPEVFIYSAMSSAIKEARQLNGKLKTNARNKVPIYGQVISMTTNKVKFEKGSAYMPVLTFPSYPSPEEFEVLGKMFSAARELQKKESVHTSTEEESSMSPDEDVAHI